MANQLRSWWQQVGFFLLVRIGFVTLHHFREFVMEWQAIIMTKSYNIIRLVPRWALYIMTGFLGSLILNLVHRGGTREAAKADPVPPLTAQSTVTGSSTAVAPSASRATPVKGKRGKGKK